MKKILISVVAVALLVPQVAMAAWWNPFTWKIFSRPSEVRVEQAHDVSVESKKATTTVISTAKISQQKEATTKENRKSITSSPKQQAETNPQKENILALTRSKEYHPSEYLGNPAIEAFIKNQSHDSFREFCNTAKTIIGHGETRQVFNEDRTSLVSREVTLYEEINSCALFLKEDIDGRGKNYTWTVNPLELLLTLNTSDSDTIRKTKLEYNGRINALPPSTLIGYINDDRIKMSPDQIGYQTVLVERSISTVIPKEEMTRAGTLGNRIRQY